MKRSVRPSARSKAKPSSGAHRSLLWLGAVLLLTFVAYWPSLSRYFSICSSVGAFAFSRNAAAHTLSGRRSGPCQPSTRVGYLSRSVSNASGQRSSSMAIVPAPSAIWGSRPSSTSRAPVSAANARAAS